MSVIDLKLTCLCGNYWNAIFLSGRVKRMDRCTNCGAEVGTSEKAQAEIVGKRDAWKLKEARKKLQ